MNREQRIRLMKRARVVVWVVCSVSTFAALVLADNRVHGWTGAAFGVALSSAYSAGRYTQRIIHTREEV